MFFFYFSICYLKKRDKFDFIFKIEFLLSMWLSVFCHYVYMSLPHGVFGFYCGFDFGGS